MSVQLWDHQQKAIEVTIQSLEAGQHRGLWVMPTGTGKTVTFATLANQLQMRTLVVVHRDELIRQTLQTFGACWPCAAVGVVQAERNEWMSHQVVVAMVQSLRTRFEAIPSDYFGLVIIDEAHHSAADSYQGIAGHFKPSFLLGCTATPERLDGKGLADLYGPAPLYVYELKKAIEEGRLVRIKQYAIRSQVDLSSVPRRGDDFAPEALGAAVVDVGRSKTAVEALRQYAGDRKTIAFCVNLDHVAQLYETLLLHGFTTARITGIMPMDERRQVLADYAAGRFQVLVNCEICTEGFDERSIGCVLMARPTQSRSLYQQMLGRGLRLCPEAGKIDCLVLDIVDNCQIHPLITATNLLGSEAVDAGGRDVLDVAREEEDERARKKRAEEEARREAEARVKLSAVEVDPFRLGAWDPALLAGYAPSAKWQRDKASEKQLLMLRSYGYAPPQGITKGAASHVLNTVAKQPTPKQRNILQRRGLWFEGMTKETARNLLDEISRREGWNQYNQDSKTPI
jgi:superfamily II DNA or RNA helicase